MQERSRFVVENGCSLRFWKDHLCDSLSFFVISSHESMIGRNLCFSSEILMGFSAILGYAFSRLFGHRHASQTKVSLLLSSYLFLKVSLTQDILFLVPIFVNPFWEETTYTNKVKFSMEFSARRFASSC